MKPVTYEIEHKSGLGAISRDSRQIYPLASLDMDYKTMQDLIESISDSEKQLLEYTSRQDPRRIRGAAPIGGVRFQAPIPYPRQDMIYLSVNYTIYTEESARYRKEEFGGERPYATYFSKRVNKATTPGGGIPSRKNIANDLDYEAELAVIIGERATNVPTEEIRGHIFGYTIINDVNTRVPQTQHKRWCLGKSPDGLLPMESCISAMSELAYPSRVQAQSRVNGELRQDSNMEFLISDIDHIVNGLSQGTTLQPETIIAAGTPARVGMSFNPPKFLRPGDVMECTVKGTGIIANQIVD